jgi:hypothetical protein
MKTFVVAGIVALGLGGLTLAACSAPPSYWPGDCDPNADFPDPDCVKLYADAGTDAADAANAFKFGTAPCFGGDCAQEPKGEFGGNWEKVPVALWVGPDGPTPLNCPETAPTEMFRLYDDLVAPPAACEACTCEASKGECTTPPAKIEIRAGTCAESGVMSVPFNGPANWDGSCTNQGGLSTGVMCGNEPCAQSVWASPLDAPSGDACSATTKIPSFTKQHAWKTRAIACEATTDNNACGSKSSYCVAKPGPEWLACVYQKGVHTIDVCPDNYRDSVHTLYPDEPVDDRNCNECACGTPLGSGCLGKMGVYDDASCSKEIVNLLLGSMGEGCTNIIPQGHAIAAKGIIDLAYLSGTCGASGGEPRGNAVVDANRGTTFCCLKPEGVME